MIVRTKIDDSTLYQNEKFTKAVNKMFKEVEKTYENTNETFGKALSTSYQSEQPQHIIELDGFDGLYEEILHQIKRAAPEFGMVTHKKELQITRMWMNRIWKGASAATHFHGLRPDEGVGIFYVDVPEGNSSDLVVIYSGEAGLAIEEYQPEELQYMNVKTGDLILHDMMLPHAVSQHNNRKPRTALIFEYRFV